MRRIGEQTMCQRQKIVEIDPAKLLLATLIALENLSRNAEQLQSGLGIGFRQLRIELKKLLGVFRGVSKFLGGLLELLAERFVGPRFYSAVPFDLCIANDRIQIGRRVAEYSAIVG